MTIEEVRAIVSQDVYALYVAKLSNGKRKELRFFNNTYGELCQLKPRSRKYGYKVSYLSYDDVVSLEKKHKSTFQRFMKRARLAYSLLLKSGLWKNMSDELAYFLGLSEEKQMEVYNDIMEDSYKKFYCEVKEGGKYPWAHTTQMYESFARNNCWAKFRYHSKYHKERVIEKLKQVINGEIDQWSEKWTNGYDNSIEIRKDSNGNLRGWFSSEYVGCGNGHYYLLFDAEHGIFYEDD